MGTGPTWHLSHKITLGLTPNHHSPLGDLQTHLHL